VRRLQIEVIHGLAILKKAAAIVNTGYGLDSKLADTIVKAADEVSNFLCVFSLVHWPLVFKIIYTCMISYAPRLTGCLKRIVRCAH
jgi:hypothetical protein